MGKTNPEEEKPKSAKSATLLKVKSDIRKGLKKERREKKDTMAEEEAKLGESLPMQGSLVHLLPLHLAADAQGITPKKKAKKSKKSDEDEAVVAAVNMLTDGYVQEEEEEVSVKKVSKKKDKKMKGNAKEEEEEAVVKKDKKGKKRKVEEEEEEPVAAKKKDKKDKKKQKVSDKEEVPPAPVIGAKAEAEKGPSSGGGGGRAFQRVKAEEWLGKKGAIDNRYEATFGDQGWGYKAQQVLGQVRGKDFRHEKTKKKRGSYMGGLIDPNANFSTKFDSDDE